MTRQELIQCAYDAQNDKPEKEDFFNAANRTPDSEDPIAAFLRELVVGTWEDDPDDLMQTFNFYMDELVRVHTRAVQIYNL